MKRQILIVDGYNMIGAWPELVKLKNQDKLSDARDLLLFELSNYGKFRGIEIVVVFDAQFVPGIQQTYQEFELTVVFTKKDETADSYIERVAGEWAARFVQITVATSDLAEQWLVFSKGALRKSAFELYKDMRETKESIRDEVIESQYKRYNRNIPWSLSDMKQLESLRDDLSK
ncbi:NYN domain-containing protein [Vagococcus lutrae]|uniref:NYN domain-containing protein n=1 Tax=Vagococcus lutrae LBD1 TaxID=1408226 RepID=V6Q2G9_9ENTE|nr:MULTISPECIES: NYN domain-containing protein [Vagococcus]EST89319.1 hypothetical protein T233_01767 [Vagococcus lutrae LBD1]MCO7150301.1 NYN domain-containing protein [Vagococcus lutrae]MDT2801896.1 NYN domain-containing protein [Vagococcus lutrae]MDT2806835.1 NYN domain-containing protein [Vagococcus lutrae]MDT2807249.1 NYN domain-containing protein [Vagococcus lutrae]